MGKKAVFDVVVLGGGPGGYVAAIRSSQLGSRVALIEKDRIGGTCTNRGCIPTKALINIAELISYSSRLEKFDVKVDRSMISYSKILTEANLIARDVRGGIEALLIKNGIEVFYGYGRLIDRKTVEVTGADGKVTILDSTSIIIATGSSPFIPPIPGVNDKRVVASENMFDIYEKPDKLIIVGAGAVGLEWGTIFNKIGTDVTIVEMMSRVLPREDEQITEYLKNICEANGMRLITGFKVNEITSTRDALTVHVEGQSDIEGDLVLMAVGRVPNSDGIGLEDLVDVERGRIVVDDHMMTKTRNIFAIGDVVGKWMLAHVAMHEGLVSAENAIGGHEVIKYDFVPRCVYTDPEVAFVGLSEKDARTQKDGDVGTVLFPLYANGRALTLERKRGAIKLIYEIQTGKILGAQIIAPQASELIGEICMAMRLEATIDDLACTIHAHPTLSEIIGEVALRGVGRAIHI